MKKHVSFFQRPFSRRPFKLEDKKKKNDEQSSSREIETRFRCSLVIGSSLSDVCSIQLVAFRDATDEQNEV